MLWKIRSASPGSSPEFSRSWTDDRPGMRFVQCFRQILRSASPKVGRAHEPFARKNIRLDLPVGVSCLEIHLRSVECVGCVGSIGDSEWRVLVSSAVFFDLGSQPPNLFLSGQLRVESHSQVFTSSSGGPDASAPDGTQALRSHDGLRTEKTPEPPLAAPRATRTRPWRADPVSRARTRSQALRSIACGLSDGT